MSALSLLHPNKQTLISADIERACTRASWHELEATLRTCNHEVTAALLQRSNIPETLAVPAGVEPATFGLGGDFSCGSTSLVEYFERLFKGFSSIQFLATIQGQTAAMEEHRKRPRHRALKAGKIIFNRRLSVMDCIVRNLSDEGASLEIGSSVGLPETFDLSIPMDGLKRSCRVGWKSTTRVGVKFQ